LTFAPHCAALLLAVTSAGQVMVQAAGATIVIMPAELFDVSGSVVLELTSAIKVMALPGDVLALTLTTKVNVALAPEARLAFEQLICPVPPTAGVVQLHPGGALNDWNVVFAGTAPWSVGLIAASGPPFITDIL
jgi:hypothetical protein